MRFEIIFWVLCAGVAASKYDCYKGFKVYNVRPENQQQLDFVASFHEKEYIDFWHASNSLETPTTVMVPPEEQAKFIHSLIAANISHNVFIEDVASFSKMERDNRRSTEKLKDGQISFTEYNNYPIIEKYIKRLSEDYPDIVTLESIGKTYEERDMWLLKIGKKGKNKPVILIDGGIHAREWITPAVVLYAIQSLVENKNNRNLIENVDWYIIPVLNPDGYEFSRTKCRAWRKNRLPVRWPDCVGVDLNRNFNYKWLTNTNCHEAYPGERPGDQLETRNFQAVVQKYKKHIKLYINFHSTGEFILLPWGYTDIKPKDHALLHGLATKVSDAIFAVNGTRYDIGSPMETLHYKAAGGSYDWVKGVGGVELSYAIEIGNHKYGFFPSPSMILGHCLEMFEGAKAYHNYIEKNFVPRH